METQIPHSQALFLILAGKAYITFKNANNGNRATYKIVKGRKPDDQGNDIFFVYAFTGTDPDLSASYYFMGVIFKRAEYRPGRRSLIKPDDVRNKIFKFVFNNLLGKTLPFFIEVWHEGRCCKCGKRMTVPESIRDGLGPECYERTFGEKAKREKNLITSKTVVYDKA